MAKPRHGFFQIDIGGLMFVNKLISFLNKKEKEARNVLKGVNEYNLNRKIYKTIVDASSEQKLDMTSRFLRDKILGGFKLRQTSKSPDGQSYVFGHPFITGNVADKEFVRHRDDGSGAWKITMWKMLDILLYGRGGYQIPKIKDSDSREMLQWKNKPHMAMKSGFAGGKYFRSKNKPMDVDPYKGVDYMKAAQEEVEEWFTSIQDKFLSKGFTS